MESNQGPLVVRFGRIAATIPVADMPRALRFYTEVFGMKTVSTTGTPVGFAVLKRDEGEVHLSLKRGHKGTLPQVCHVLVDDARSLYDHCVSHGVRIVKGLREQRDGRRDFILADPDGNRIEIEQPALEATSPSSARMHLNIVCIEDSSSDAELLTERLWAEWPDAKITTVDTEPKLRAALDQHPDAVISDSNVPGFSGLAALALCRRVMPQVPFIFFCGDQREAFRDEAKKSGASAFVSKNDPQPLVHELRRLLNLR